MSVDDVNEEFRRALVKLLLLIDSDPKTRYNYHELRKYLSDKEIRLLIEKGILKPVIEGD